MMKLPIRIPFTLILVSAIAMSSLAGQGTVIVAQVISGGTNEFSFQTVFKLLNQSRVPSSYKIELFGQDGQPMRAFGSRSSFLANTIEGVLNPLGTIETRTPLGPFASPLIGWARITTSEKVGVAAVLLNYRRSDLEIVMGTALTASPATDALAGFSDDLGIGSLEQIGLALANPSADETATVDLYLLQIDGSVALKRTLTLGPLTQLARFLGQSPLFPDLENINPGSVELRSSIPIAVAFIRVDDGVWSPLPAFPARDLALDDSGKQSSNRPMSRPVGGTRVGAAPITSQAWSPSAAEKDVCRFNDLHARPACLTGWSSAASDHRFPDCVTVANRPCGSRSGEGKEVNSRCLRRALTRGSTAIPVAFLPIVMSSGNRRSRGTADSQARHLGYLRL